MTLLTAPPEIVLATHNPGKSAEFQASWPEIQWILLSQYGQAAPEETGVTFIENALIKARAATKLSNKPSLADDSGLIVPALNGAPGVFSARYAGPAATDRENNEKLLHALEGERDRRAYFVCVLAFLTHPEDPCPLIAQGIWPGEITRAPKGTSGFGYNPIFWIPSLQKTAAELSLAEKNHYSHRALALKALKAQFRDLHGTSNTELL